MDKNEKEAFKLSIKLLENLIMLKDYKSKEEITFLVNNMVANVEANAEYPKVIKDAYNLLARNIEVLEFADILELKSILLEEMKDSKK